LASISFEINPHEVLGVAPDASLEQIRDAYRRKTKSLHPDAGGEEWAFRVLVRSYEMLSTARVMRAVQPGRDRAASTGSSRRSTEPSTETIRGGIHDADVSPSRLVGVEHLCVRYLWDDAAYLWLSQQRPDEERFLSCSLNLTWPDAGTITGTVDPADASAIVQTLKEITERIARDTPVISARSDVHEDQFAGWLSYSNFEVSWKALKSLHAAVRERGLGLRQWSRDLFIPKNWK
jgi:hypothetical protein